MSVLRKKYYSNLTRSFLDVPTEINSNVDSTDIGNLVNNETVRLIKYNDNLDSSKLDELIADLIYNDKILLSNYEKTNSLISNGTFYSVGDDFQIYDVQKVDYTDGTYIKSFGIKGGQIKYNDEIIFLEALESYKTTFASGTGNTIRLNNVINLSVGNIVFGSEIQDGTEIIGITGTQVQLSKNLISNISANSLILFMDIPTFTIGNGALVNKIDEISLTGAYPVWRSDTICFDFNEQKWEIIKGQEILNIPPINTQLDAVYQVESIIHLTQDFHRVKLVKNNRVLSNDFSLTNINKKYAKIKLTNNKTFDGEYEIVEIDSINNSITVKIPLIKNNYKDQTEKGGYIDIKRIAMFSVIIYKASASAPSLIIDKIEKIALNSGITGGIQNIIRAQIERSGKYYSIKSNDYVHLIDLEGRLLDWEEGQGKNIAPVIGYDYSSIHNLYDEFQIPFPDYAPVESGYLSNIPFIFENVENNVFGLQEISLIQFKLAVKNDPISIGQEGIQYRISTYPTLSDEIGVYSVDIQRGINNSIIKTIISNPAINFINLGINVNRKDFILITSGPGSYQIGQITEVGTNYISIINLFKDVTTTSKFIIFNNTQNIINDSEKTITNSLVKSQVLSGVNGVFGQDNVYSKVILQFGDELQENFPKIEIKKWHFIELKNYNDNSLQQGSPYIVIENIQNNLVYNSSAYVEVYYRTIIGKYPNGNILIEDEFGDIYIEQRARTEAPHFRPAKYELFSRGLDKDVLYPQNEEDVFVDVHTGRIQFHPLAVPRKLFVSYNKYDIIDGNSTDFSIKHINSETGLQNNVQDKISEIDSRFNNTTEIRKTWLVNGLITKENSGFAGPFKIDEQNSYNIIYKDNTFENFTFDEDNYNIKFSNHLYDTPIYMGQNNVILDDTNFEVLNDGSNFVSNELIVNFTFLDYQSGVSGFTLPQIGHNSFDEYFVPVNEYLVNDLNSFYKKKKLFENPNIDSRMFIDSGLYDTDYGVYSNWNYLYSSFFGKNNVFYGLLRKYNYEILPLNLDNNLKFRLRQREFIKLLDKNFNDIETKSETKILSEKFLAKSLIYDNIKYKENYIQLKVESTKYKDYQFIPAQDIDGTSLSLNNVSHNISSNFSLSFKKSSIFINNNLITVYIDLSSEKPYYNIISFSKTKEIQDIDKFNYKTPPSINLIEDIKVYQIKSCIFNNNYLAVGYVYQDTEDLNYFIKIQVFLIDESQTTFYTLQPLDGSEKNIGPIIGDYYFNLSEVGINKIGVIWKRSETNITSVIYTYSFTNKISHLGEVKIIENQFSLNSNPSISYFGKDNFIIGYTNSLGIKLKSFDLNNNLNFFDNNNLIDYRTLTNYNLSSSDNVIRILELKNNDIAIVFLDKNSNLVSYDLKLVILDSWTGNWKYPLNSENSVKSSFIPIILEYQINVLITDVSLCILNEDIFCISYIKNSQIYLKAFKNDGGQVYSSYIDQSPGSYSLTTTRVSDHSIILTYLKTLSGNTNYVFSVYNFRPDFSKDSRVNQSFELDTYIIGNPFKIINFSGNSFFYFLQASTSLTIKIINTDDRNKHYLNPNYSPFSLSLDNLNKLLDINYVSFYIGNTLVKVILILWAETSKMYCTFIKVTNNSMINAGRIQITDFTETIYVKTFGQITHIKDSLVGIILRTTTRTYNMHGINLSVLATENTFGASEPSKYTNSFSKVFSPINTTLSGANTDYEVVFYKKNDNSFFMVYSAFDQGSVTGAFASSISSTNDYINIFGEIDFNSSLTVSERSVVDNSRQFQTINFVADPDNSNVIFTFGNSSGVGKISRINFNNPESITQVTLNVTSGTITDKPKIFNTNSNNIFILAYNETVETTQNFRFYYINKTTLIKIDTKPSSDNLFADLGNKGNILRTIKSSYSDIYMIFINNSKIYSRTFSAYFSGDFENESVMKETDELGNTRKRIFTDYSLKINGINWKGEVIPAFPVYSVSSLNLDSSQIDDDNIFRSDIFNISAHLVSISKDSFSIIYHYYKEKSSEIGIKLRNFVIYRNRIFADSDWITGKSEIAFESIKEKIYLRAIQYSDQNIFYIWKDPITKMIKKAVVNKYNNIMTGTYGELIQTNNSAWIILRSDILIEDWIVALLYNVDTNKFSTVLFDPQSNLHRFGESFSLPFNITTDSTSQVTINKFGYFMWTYLDENQNLRYYQHGFDGDPWGVAQVVGKNYLGHIDSSADSPIEKNFYNSSTFKFLTYNRIDIILNKDDSIKLNEIYKSQETGLYRVLCIDNPIINFTFSLINQSEQEPIVSIDTSTSFISQVKDTNDKFNLYISDLILTFQNKLSKTMRFRFYKEN